MTRLHSLPLAVFFILLSATGWPSFEFTVFSRPISLEPAMFVVLVVGGLTTFKLLVKGLPTNKWSNTSPAWKLLAGWFIFATANSLVSTMHPGPILLNAVYSLAAVSLTLGAWNTSKLSVTKVMEVWSWAAVIVSTVGIVQFLLAAFSSYSPVLASSSIGVFSFPRVHGLSLEPLYFANWLLPPAIFMVWSMKKQKSNRAQLGLLVVLTALALTLARGAFIALAIAMIAMAIKKKVSFKKLATTASAALLACLLLVGASTAANSNDSAISGALRYLDHATMGVFNSAGATNTLHKETATPTTQSPATYDHSALDTEGVVEGSTIDRIETSKDALTVFSDTPKNILLGVGKNRFGEEAGRLFTNKYADSSIVNNQPLEVLVETGVVGLALIIAASIIFWRDYLRNLDTAFEYLSYILLALLIQWLFYSNYNSFPLWMIIGLVVSAASSAMAKNGKTIG